MAQSWGGKLLQFVLFLFLARLLTQAEFGLAVAVSTFLLLLAALAEFGFGEALIQRRAVDARDIDLPFFLSMSVSFLLGCALALLSSRIEAWSGHAGLAPLLVVAGLALPLATASTFQEALYKRQLDFRTLALRQVVALTLSGAIAIACAFAGWGALSMLIQHLLFVAVSALILWSRPKWTPALSVHKRALPALARYGASVTGNRLLDFFTTRMVEFIILLAHGAAGLGIYAVGARVHVTLIQLFVTSVTDVSFSALSRISHDSDRLRRAYFRSISASALLTVPVFIGVAALSDEYAVLLFGGKWADAAGVMTPLLLAGSVQGVQFINSAYFAALGKPHITLSLNILKFACVATVLIAMPTGSIVTVATLFAAAQLVTTPFSFALVCRHIGIRPYEILRHLAPSYIAALSASAAVLYLRPYLAAFDIGLPLETLSLTLAFGLFYSLIVLALAGRHILDLLHLVRHSKSARGAQ